mmetsp:Transcript_9400/g.18321  ORF Transcript_9400/g.18321 Transcript_9400/m.18321 type:complete len:488 (+) Transcript_9400:1441-2904(+)
MRTRGNWLRFRSTIRQSSTSTRTMRRKRGEERKKKQREGLLAALLLPPQLPLRPQLPPLHPPLIAPTFVLLRWRPRPLPLQIVQRQQHPVSSLCGQPHDGPQQTTTKSQNHLPPPRAQEVLLLASSKADSRLKFFIDREWGDKRKAPYSSGREREKESTGAGQRRRGRPFPPTHFFPLMLPVRRGKEYRTGMTLLLRLVPLLFRLPPDLQIPTQPLAHPLYFPTRTEGRALFSILQLPRDSERKSNTRTRTDTQRTLCTTPRLPLMHCPRIFRTERTPAVPFPFTFPPRQMQREKERGGGILVLPSHPHPLSVPPPTNTEMPTPCPDLPNHPCSCRRDTGKKTGAPRETEIKKERGHPGECAIRETSQFPNRPLLSHFLFIGDLPFHCPPLNNRGPAARGLWRAATATHLSILRGFTQRVVILFRLSPEGQRETGGEVFRILCLGSMATGSSRKMIMMIMEMAASGPSVTRRDMQARIPLQQKDVPP